MDKFYIVVIGRRNTGKSSLVNAILGQDKAVVSSIAGTTTDPVRKSYEIPGVASIVLVDTAGIDDEGELGQLRVDKTYEALKEADAAILVISENKFGNYEEALIQKFQTLHQPFFIVHNKSDQISLSSSLQNSLANKYNTEILNLSTHPGDPQPVIEAISRLIQKPVSQSLLARLIKTGQTVMLVTPIDSEAPTGRMILPQIQMLRDSLDHHCICIVVQPEEIPLFFAKAAFRPDLIITDSQAFAKVSAWVPKDIPMTSFSIVLAHHKGNFENYLQGTPQIANLNDGDRILMLESCSHHVSCEDIGRIKIPALLRKHTGKQLKFDFISGLDKIKRPFTDYALIIQCGGCMVTQRQLHNRLQPAIEANIPVSNYGMTIAWIQGIFDRVTQPFRH